MSDGGLTVSRAHNKGLSRYRKGFPVKLSKDHVLQLHLTYLWMQRHGETTTAMDELIALLPTYSEGQTGAPSWATYRDRKRVKTIRVRGPEVPTMILLLQRAALLPFSSASTLRNRADDLKKLNTMDLMVDAQRE